MLRFGAELESRGTMVVESTQYGTLHGATHSTLDVSDAVNRAVARHGGEGIVALSVENENCALSYFFPLTMLPFWPGCQHARVTGVVVRRRAGVASSR